MLKTLIICDFILSMLVSATKLEIKTNNNYANSMCVAPPEHDTTSLCEKSQVIKYRNPNGVWSKLHNASCENNIEIIKQEIQNGCYVDLINDHEETPLFWASLCGSEAAVELLISLGADVSFSNYKGYTPLHVSGYDIGSSNITMMLIQNGGNIRAKNIFGSTPLHSLTFETHSLVLNECVNNRINNCDNEETIAKNKANVITSLIQHEYINKDDLNLANYCNETPNKIASWHNIFSFGHTRRSIDRFF